MEIIEIDNELDLGITLSVIDIKAADFEKWKTDIPFYKNVDREGISLWKMA